MVSSENSRNIREIQRSRIAILRACSTFQKQTKHISASMIRVHGVLIVELALIVSRAALGLNTESNEKPHELTSKGEAFPSLKSRCTPDTSFLPMYLMTNESSGITLNVLRRGEIRYPCGADRQF